ncbi:hypothetical protein EDB85DRAFT_1893147 [Lactarius pseudohatsudake]|nr:hypothetical protein EDB85DRAFT_1893147 [Lactarius pseudohatsudake]
MYKGELSQLSRVLAVYVGVVVASLVSSVVAIVLAAVVVAAIVIGDGDSQAALTVVGSCVPCLGGVTTGIAGSGPGLAWWRVLLACGEGWRRGHGLARQRDSVRNNMKKEKKTHLDARRVFVTIVLRCGHVRRRVWGLRDRGNGVTHATSQRVCKNTGKNITIYTTKQTRTLFEGSVARGPPQFSVGHANPTMGSGVNWQCADLSGNVLIVVVEEVSKLLKGTRSRIGSGPVVLYSSLGVSYTKQVSHIAPPGASPYDKTLPSLTTHVHVMTTMTATCDDSDMICDNKDEGSGSWPMPTATVIAVIATPMPTMRRTATLKNCNTGCDDDCNYDYDTSDSDCTGNSRNYDDPNKINHNKTGLPTLQCNNYMTTTIQTGGGDNSRSLASSTDSG